MRIFLIFTVFMFSAFDICFADDEMAAPANAVFGWTDQASKASMQMFDCEGSTSDSHQHSSCHDTCQDCHSCHTWIVSANPVPFAVPQIKDLSPYRFSVADPFYIRLKRPPKLNT